MKTKTKILIGVLTPVAAIILAFAVLCFVTMGAYSPAFLGRVLTHFDSSVSDCNYFPARVIKKSGKPFIYEKDFNPSLNYLDEFAENTDTTSLIIVKNDKIVYEKYANGYTESTVNTSFSMAKSVVSLLVGRAIEKGFIGGVEDKISKYIDEFKDKAIGETTIAQLLAMRSDIVYDENKFLWFGDDSLTYWYDDLRTLALSHTALADYGGKFHYNNYHPLLLGIILERATGESVSEFFEREIWQKIGAEHDASWSLDSENGFEKMESGINFYAVDFIKIGSMVAHGGYFNGERIIDEAWLKTSTLCETDPDRYEGTFLEGKNTGYKYMWYCTQSGDIVAWGKSDQILYISPVNDTVILRTGKSDGGVKDWIAKLKEIMATV